VVNKAKYVVIIDEVEDYTKKGKFVNAIVYFSIYNGEEKLLESFTTFDYEDESTKEYVRDIARLFREIGAFI
jgi:hypothetical protein